MPRNTWKGYSFSFNLGEIRNSISKYCWKFLTLFSVFWSRNLKHFARQINPTHQHSMTKYCQKLSNVFAGEIVWHCIVSFLTLLSYKWRRICFNSYGKSSSWETSNFQQYIFLTSRLLISASNDTGEKFCWTWYLCEGSTRSLSMMDKLLGKSQHGL